MDRVFLLSPDARSRFLRSAACALGCAYICLWSPLHSSPSDLIPVSYFASKDGYWHGEDEEYGGGGSRPSPSAPSPSRRLFDRYRTSLCIIQCSYVPGWAYKSSLPYIELRDSDLLGLASLPVQRQFYQEAGIKTAVFLGCASGEIEFGITTSDINGNLHLDAHRVFREEFIQQSLQLGGDQELVPSPALLDHSRASSSSSSLRSVSASSPEYSPLAEAAAALPHQVAHMQALYGRAGGARRSADGGSFSSPASDEAAMAMAILAVISSNNSSTQTAAPDADERGAYRSHSAARPVGVFVPYSRAHAARADAAAAAVPIAHGQKMIKTAISHLRAINSMKLNEATKAAAAAAAAAAQEVRPTSTQLHHMISERKRREKLNGSFNALKMLLPPGSKRDKASVLANTREYVNTLKAQIQELEERNRLLLGAATTHQSRQPDQIGDQTREIDSIQVQIESTSDQTQGLDLTLTVRSAEGDMIDIILGVLECLKRMGDDSVRLVSMEASRRSPPSDLGFEARFKLRVIKGGEWDEDSFKEGVRKAIDDAVAKSRPSD